MLGVGFLSGGYVDDELARADAHGVDQDPAVLLLQLNEVSVRAAS